VILDTVGAQNFPTGRDGTDRVDIPAGELTRTIDGLDAFLQAYVWPYIKGNPDSQHPLPVSGVADAKGIKDDIERAMEVLREAREGRRTVETMLKFGHQASQVMRRHGRRRAP
jgi:hypothetical protein